MRFLSIISNYRHLLRCFLWCTFKNAHFLIKKSYQEKFQALRKAYPGSRLLIVSNSAGTNDDVDGKEANLLEAATGVKVLRHSTKKPGCGRQILDYFYDTPDSNVTLPSQIAVVGDRLSTDVVMANMMGSWSIWVKDGVVREKSLVRFVARVMGCDPDMNTDITMGVQTASLLVPQGFRSFTPFLTHKSYVLSKHRLLSFATPRPTQRSARRHVLQCADCYAFV